MTALLVDRHSWTTTVEPECFAIAQKMISREILGWTADFKAHDKLHHDLCTRNQQRILLLVNRPPVEPECFEIAQNWFWGKYSDE